jgi:hypothetical protein
VKIGSHEFRPANKLLQNFTDLYQRDKTGIGLPQGRYQLVGARKFLALGCASSKGAIKSANKWRIFLRLIAAEWNGLRLPVSLPLVWAHEDRASVFLEILSYR